MIQRKDSLFQFAIVGVTPFPHFTFSFGEKKLNIDWESKRGWFIYSILMGCLFSRVNKNEIKNRRTKIDDVFSLSIKSALLSLIAKKEGEGTKLEPQNYKFRIIFSTLERHLFWSSAFSCFVWFIIIAEFKVNQYNLYISKYCIKNRNALAYFNFQIVGFKISLIIMLNFC